MSVAIMLQALGWVSVLWLVTVHLLIQRGRLRQNGKAYRIAGCAAAASVVAASAAEELWPVAVLGLLWLRIEVFGHRNHVPECRPEAAALDVLGADPDFGGPHLAGRDPVPEPESMPTLLVGALTQGNQRPTVAPGAKDSAHPQRHSHAPHIPLPHIPHPHLAPRVVDRVFKVEMGIVIVIALVFFGIWAEQQRASFAQNTNYVVCNWIEGC